MRTIVAYAREGRREQIEGARGGDTHLADANLTAAGIQEALNIARLAAKLPMGALLTSPARAANQTGLVMQRILSQAGMNVPLTTSKSLIDLGFVLDEDSAAIQRRGESYNDFQKRIKVLHRAIRAAPPIGVVGIVTHQKVIGAALELAIGHEHRVKAGTLTVITYDDQANATLLALSASSFSKADVAEIQRLARQSTG